MFRRLLHLAGNLAFALLTGLFGGYIAAAVVAVCLSWTLNFIGFNITTTDIISSFFGIIILAVAFAVFAAIGWLTGNSIQNWINGIFVYKK